MKKNLKYAILSAIALVGTVSFSACQSNEEIVDNPNVVGEAVKTQFTISLPQNVIKSTRQSAATVQADQTTASFRGFQDMVLIPYASVTSNNVSGNRLTETSITLTPVGGTAADANTLPAAGLGTYNDNTATPAHINNAYVYSDVVIPFGTSGFLFYGKAIDAGTNKFVDGALTASPTTTSELLTGEKDGFGFALNVIKDGDGKAAALLAYINSIAAAAPASPAKAWYTSVTDGGNAGLLGLYNNFITMKAGSSTSVQAALEDLYESLMNNTDATSQAVCTAILTKATYTAGNAENERLVLNSTVAGYPADINLPDGAVGLSWNTSTTPATATWLDDNSAWNTGSATVGSTNVTALDKFVYPASLYYRADSPVKVSNSKQSTSYSAQDGWDNIITNLYKDGATVSSSTQSVALVEQIQYAVAQLQSTITFAQAALKDRNGDDVTLGTDGTFDVTGILIGGQKNVDWQFLPTTTSAIYTIYDNDIPASNVLTMSTASTPAPTQVLNYTLALENTADETVYVALEIENNARDFIGKDGLIAKGTKFYLVAALDPSTGTGYSSGTLDKVFMQDYVTTATFTIGANLTGSPDPSDPTKTIYPHGIGAAYNVIPDLRTPKMELGLSVNLAWQTGLSFDVTF